MASPYQPSGPTELYSAPLDPDEGSPSPSREALGQEEWSKNPFPPPVLTFGEEKLEALRVYVDDWLFTLQASQAEKQNEWAEIEKDYRARGLKSKDFPFKGASGDEIPLQAMAVDPIVARLDTGIFKQDPPFRTKALRKSLKDFEEPLQKWVNFYNKHIAPLRNEVAPRLVEYCKLGTMVLKTVYERDTHTYMTYGKDFKPERKTSITFQGPRVKGVSLGDFLFPPTYEDLQDCPFVAERQRTTIDALRIAEKQGMFANVDSVIVSASTVKRTPLEDARDSAAKHSPMAAKPYGDIEVWECWCKYDIDGDGLPECLVITYEPETRTFLQLRYNWYFHQRFPYTVIPYMQANDSLYGIGIGEMVKPFQASITKWNQMAQDNAYLANIRMFIAKTNSPRIEDVPRLYPGRVFWVDNPKEDFIPFQAGDTYPSTLAQQQSTLGYAEKRTGVSDYLTGRESPVVGSRATATSTLALIQEGTRRVEQVVENLRAGLNDVLLNYVSIWGQYGIGAIDDMAFGEDDVKLKVEEFFTAIVPDRPLRGAIAFELQATDATTNRPAMQQLQLSLINLMSSYYERTGRAVAMAIQAQQQGQPQAAAAISAILDAAQKLHTDLLTKYEVPAPEDYIPDLTQYIEQAGGMQGANGMAGLAGAGGGMGGFPGGLGGPAGIPFGAGMAGGGAGAGMA